MDFNQPESITPQDCVKIHAAAADIRSCADKLARAARELVMQDRVMRHHTMYMLTQIQVMQDKLDTLSHEHKYHVHDPRD